MTQEQKFRLGSSLGRGNWGLEEAPGSLDVGPNSSLAACVLGQVNCPLGTLVHSFSCMMDTLTRTRFQNPQLLRALPRLRTKAFIKRWSSIPLALGVFTFSITHPVIHAVPGGRFRVVFVTVHQQDGALSAGAPGPGPLWMPSRDGVHIRTYACPSDPLGKHSHLFPASQGPQTVCTS